MTYLLFTTDKYPKLLVERDSKEACEWEAQKRKMQTCMIIPKGSKVHLRLLEKDKERFSAPSDHKPNL